MLRNSTQYLFFICIGCFTGKLYGQTATISETSPIFKTYPYSDPNPLPAMGLGKKFAPFYPYFMFDGYTDKPVNKNWKVVQLENPHIKVTVLPEVGGKVGGAIEKKNQNEFIYLNKVMKFRAIGIRGPWTSGGIEHNFGLDLGHAPWAAGAVDYVNISNPDGSVSCIVGGLDLASRTEWRVEVRLSKDEAQFTTDALWYNPTPIRHAYLSWENAAYKASDDLQLYFPGNYHIDHNGNAAAWPVDASGRDLSNYKQNNFGGDKSYHVMGHPRNWFGGYWHNQKVGFGHWAPYTDAPGKKLWIWSLAREGGIWEDLLTDTDGQYIEAQSGVTFNQPSLVSGFHSPFRQKSLKPFYSETKKEYWFPVTRTGGMSDASAFGTLHAERIKDSLKIIINPTIAINDTLAITLDGKTQHYVLHLKPMELYQKTIAVAAKNYRLSVGKDFLLYDSDPATSVLPRPVATVVGKERADNAERLFRIAEDENAMRNYDKAREIYARVLEMEPSHSDALSRMAEYYYRTAAYASGLSFAAQAISYNQYDGAANYIYGHLLLKLDQLTQAEEALSVAAQTMEFRSAAYTALAGIRIRKLDFNEAIAYAQKSIDYNKNNLRAYQYLITACRHLKQKAAAQQWVHALLQIDPLSHYARFENYLLEDKQDLLQGFKDAIRNELPHETYLELALTYAEVGLTGEAIKLLQEAPSYPMVYYWLAYLQRNNAKESQQLLQQATALSTDFVFPFRPESIAVLQWAAQANGSWKNQYYLGLLYWSCLQPAKATALLDSCGSQPGTSSFYITRGILSGWDAEKKEKAGADFFRALQLAPAQWRAWHYWANQLTGAGKLSQAVDTLSYAYAQFKGNPIIAIDYAKSLLNTGKYESCLRVLKEVLILPQEGGREGHELFELTHLTIAMDYIEKGKYKPALLHIEQSRQWPENLGSGRPYDPDERLQDLLTAFCWQKSGKKETSEKYLSQLHAYSLLPENWDKARPADNLISLTVMQQRGKAGEAAILLNQWSQKQDSLSYWSLAEGAAGKEYQWVMRQLKKEATAEPVTDKKTITRFALTQRALSITPKIQL